MQSTIHNTLQVPSLLTSREAAKLLNISERTLWQLTADGKLPAVHIGRSVRYDITDIHAFIDRCKTRPYTD